MRNYWFFRLLTVRKKEILPNRFFLFPAVIKYTNFFLFHETKNFFPKRSDDQGAFEVSAGRWLPKAQVGCCPCADGQEGTRGDNSRSKGHGVRFSLSSHPASCFGLRLEHQDQSGALMGTAISVRWQRCPALRRGEKRSGGGPVAHHMVLQY